MSNIHIIIGEDDFLVAQTAKKIVGDGVGLEVIDSVNATNADLQLADMREVDASFSTPPFLDPRKVTWWKNVGFLPQGGKEGPSEEVKEKLEAFAERIAGATLPENQHFILTGPRLLMTSIFAKRLKGVAEIITFSAGKGKDLSRSAVVRAIDFAKDAGFRFASGAAERFVEHVGTDTRSLLSEVGKMRDYLGERDVATIDDIDEITSAGVGVEPEIWSITDALGERNVAALAKAVRRFEQESGFAVMVTTVVERFFRQLVELKDAQSRGLIDPMEARTFPMSKNIGYLRHWTLRELRVARYRFLTLREKAVSTSGSAKVLVLPELIRAALAIP